MAKEKARTRQDPWLAWTSRLSPLAQQILAGQSPSPAASEYDRWQASLSPLVQQQLQQLTSQDGEDAPPIVVDEEICRWGVVESPSGEYPVLRLFKTPEALARHVGALEGKDVAVWCFYGRPLALTHGPQRYLLLPDDQTALTVPLYVGGPCRRMDASLLDGVMVQEDGFLGHPALLETIALPGPEEDDAEDEDDEDDEEAAPAG